MSGKRERICVSPLVNSEGLSGLAMGIFAANTALPASARMHESVTPSVYCLLIRISIFPSAKRSYFCARRNVLGSQPF